MERIERNLKTLIRTFLTDEHSKWDQNLPEFVYAYTSVHSSLTVSPTYLNFGRDPRYLDLLRGGEVLTELNNQNHRSTVLSLIDELWHCIIDNY